MLLGSEQEHQPADRVGHILQELGRSQLERGLLILQARTGPVLHAQRHPDVPVAGHHLRHDHRHRQGQSPRRTVRHIHLDRGCRSRDHRQLLRRRQGAAHRHRPRAHKRRRTQSQHRGRSQPRPRDVLHVHHDRLSHGHTRTRGGQELRNPGHRHGCGSHRGPA